MAAPSGLATLTINSLRNNIYSEIIILDTLLIILVIYKSIMVSGKIKKALRSVENTAVKTVKTAKKIEKIAAKTAKIGTAVSSFAAAPTPGGALRLFDVIRGKGDYSVTRNSIAVDTLIGTGMQMPRFSGSERSLRVRHTEYLGDIISSGTTGAFSLTSYSINPGSIATFPWLSKIAQSYDQWEPYGIVFGFKSTSAAFNGTTQALGTVILATDYDVSDPAYSSKLEMENSEFAVSCSADCSQLHPIECAAAERNFTKYFVREGLSLPSTENAKFYDIGNFQVATVGITGTSVNLGELWVTYDIELSKQQYNPEAGLLVYHSSDTANLGSYFSTVPTTNTSNTFSLTTTSTTMTFPSYLTNQTFRVRVAYTGTAATIAAPTVTYTSNCVVGPVIHGGGASATFPSGVSSATCSFEWSVTLTGPAAVMTLSGGTLPSSLTRIDVWLNQIQPS